MKVARRPFLTDHQQVLLDEFQVRLQEPGERDLAALASDLTVEQRAALRFPRDRRRCQPPSESTFFRLLANVKPDELDIALLVWQEHVLGRCDPAGDHVAVDGKELIDRQGMEIVSAYSVQNGRCLG